MDTDKNLSGMMVFSWLCAATCRFWNEDIGRGHYVHTWSL